MRDTKIHQHGKHGKMEINVIKTRRGCENQVVLSATLESRRLLETDLRIIIVFQGGVDETGWDRCDQGRNCRHFNAKNNLYSVLYKNRQNLGISVHVSAFVMGPLLLSGAACRSSIVNADLRICDAF
jgi:hypothetical protein